MQVHRAAALAGIFLFAPGLLTAVEPVSVVRSSDDLRPRQPQLAVAEDGTTYIAFGSEEAVYVCKSADGGRTYGEPVKVGEIAGLALGRRRGPRVAVGSGVVVVSAIGHEEGDLLAWRSLDGGATWSGPVPVNDSPGHASEGLHAMAIGPAGQVYCAWLDHRNGAKQLFGTGSSDGGQTWDESRQIYASPSGNICECCHPSVAYDERGHLYVMWRNSLGGYRDMYLSISRDGGTTFSAAEKLGRGGWKLEACPMDGGSLAVSPAGKVTTVWRREDRVYRTDSRRPTEQLIGRGMQPWAAATADGAYVVWLSQRGGTLWLATPSDDEPRLLADGAGDPVIAAPTAGNGPVVAVWEENEGEASGLQALVVTSGRLPIRRPVGQ